jgi:hypothetical protein
VKWFWRERIIANIVSDYGKREGDVVWFCRVGVYLESDAIDGGAGREGPGLCSCLLHLGSFDDATSVAVSRNKPKDQERRRQRRRLFYVLLLFSLRSEYLGKSFSSTLHHLTYSSFWHVKARGLQKLSFRHGLIFLRQTTDWRTRGEDHQ